jgi:hypothetical protein
MRAVLAVLVLAVAGCGGGSGECQPYARRATGYDYVKQARMVHYFTCEPDGSGSLVGICYEYESGETRCYDADMREQPDPAAAVAEWSTVCGCRP